MRIYPRLIHRSVIIIYNFLIKVRSRSCSFRRTFREARHEDPSTASAHRTAAVKHQYVIFRYEPRSSSGRRRQSIRFRER